MDSNKWIRKAISSCLMVALLATYSMIVFAGAGVASGELIVTGKSMNGVTPVVTVNGETARTGRTIFSSSTVKTPENTTATVDMGTAGVIELSPNTSLIVSFDSNTASVDLADGTMTVLRSNQPINVNAAGGTRKLSAGDSASAAGGTDDHDYRDSSGKCVDANHNGKEECDSGGAAWWLWALVFGGAAAGIVVAASQGSNSIALGGGGTVVSPTR